MSNFKAGDLALIANCPIAPEMVGKCVYLVGRMDPGDWYGEFHNFTRSPAWVVKGKGLLSMDGFGSWALCSQTAIEEKHLLPLRGDFQPEQQKSQEVPV